MTTESLGTLPEHPFDRGQSIDDCDEDIRLFLARLTDSFRQLLSGNLVGVYVHGSLAMGCFRRAKSDCDVLVVAANVLGQQTRRDAAILACDLSDERPTVGDLEMHVLLADRTRSFTHPLPFEVHYGSEWKKDIRAGRAEFPDTQTDRDLAAHCTSVRARGRTLTGSEIPDVFGPVPREAYLDALLYDLEWITQGENILQSPFYGVLNACRILMVLTEEEAVPSKEEGAIWAGAHLPPEHHALIRLAMACYQSGREVSEDERRTDGHPWDREALMAFKEFVAHRAVGLGEQ